MRKISAPAEIIGMDVKQGDLDRMDPKVTWNSKMTRILVVAMARRSHI